MTGPGLRYFRDPHGIEVPVDDLGGCGAVTVVTVGVDDLPALLAIADGLFEHTARQAGSLLAGDGQDDGRARQRQRALVDLRGPRGRERTVAREEDFAAADTRLDREPPLGIALDRQCQFVAERSGGDGLPVRRIEHRAPRGEILLREPHVLQALLQGIQRRQRLFPQVRQIRAGPVPLPGPEQADHLRPERVGRPAFQHVPGAPRIDALPLRDRVVGEVGRCEPLCGG